MIDFANGSVFKLNQCDPNEVGPMIGPLFIQGEQLIWAFKSVRDFVAFTDKRIISVNIQASPARRRISRACPTARSRRSRWRPPGRSISMPSWSSGSAGWARCGSSSRWIGHPGHRPDDRNVRAQLMLAANLRGEGAKRSGVFPENGISRGLHQWAGFRTIGVRERAGRHHGVWRDVVLIEHRSSRVGR